MKSQNPTSIRFPESLSNWLKKQAVKNQRSVSGEIIFMVGRIKEKQEKQEQATHEPA